MIAALLFAAALATEPGAVRGTVRVTRAHPDPAVLLVVDRDRAAQITGELTGELRRIGGATVEIVGLRDGDKLIAKAYRILDVGGGARPLAVGTVVVLDSGLGLQVDEGPPLSLRARPKQLEKLNAAVGAKIWVVGEKLLSGEIKAAYFGVLREPAPLSPPPE